VFGQPAAWIGILFALVKLYLNFISFYPACEAQSRQIFVSDYTLSGCAIAQSQKRFSVPARFLPELR
jgi:hypothetical protein